MFRLMCLGCIAGILLSRQSDRVRTAPSICEVGSSIVDEMNLQVTAGKHIEPVVLGGSLTFIEACPAALMPAFKRLSNDEQSVRHAWIVALQSAAGSQEGSDLRGLLSAAKKSVDRVGDESLVRYLDGAFDILRSSGNGDGPSFDSLVQNQAVASFQSYSQCDGAVCFDASDNLLFLLATHPAAFFKAMRADQGDAKKWLRELGDMSFARLPSERKNREAARSAVLAKVSEVMVSGFTSERHACESTLRQIRFREWQ